MGTATIRRAHAVLTGGAACLLVVGLAGCSSARSAESAADPTTTTRATPTTTLTTTAPVPKAPVDESDLTSVSCVTNGRCLAVGYGEHLTSSAPSSSTLTLSRSGSTAPWSTGPAGILSGSQAVSCFGSGTCLAVGGAGTTAGHPVTGFQEWNGHTWRALAPLPSSSTTGTAPDRISCTSDQFCVAVGGQAGQSSAIERWTGEGWAAPVLSLFLPTGSGTAYFSGVSCATPTFCVVVGRNSVNASDVGIVEQWDGAQWREVPTPTLVGDADLQDVSCSSSTFCLAVGTLTPPATGPTPAPTQLIAEAWNGSSWAVTSAPHPFGTDLSESLPVPDCTSASFCMVGWSSTWATDRFGGPTPPDAGFASTSQVWNGSRWVVEPMPNPDPATGTYNLLSAMSCATPDDCVTAGGSFGGASHAILEHWDGSTWSGQSIPAA